MVMSSDEVIPQARQLLKMKNGEDSRLDLIHAYMTNTQSLPWATPDITPEIARLAKISRVNFLSYVVNASTQSMYVDGYRAPKQEDDESAWEVWQRNKMDARQIGIHRGALAYGASYATVTPGDPVPYIRGVSPRRMTAVYGQDDEWPVYGLEQQRGSSELYRLYDDEAVYVLYIPRDSFKQAEHIDTMEHDAGVCPIVRYRETSDLDDEVTGEVEPLMALQDQINVTTFSLLVAQHYGAFRQRYILGWLAESEQDRLKASSSSLWTFEDNPDDVEVGEFSQTDLSGYINSREASLKHLATVSQTPAHELLGEMVNLSAEALAAANDSKRRKITERQTVLGESHEQTLQLAGEMMGEEPDPSAYVRWKDTEAHTMSQMSDALGKLVQQLGVPPQELWEMVPGVSQQQVERWKNAADQGDSYTEMMELLEKQAGGAG